MRGPSMKAPRSSPGLPYTSTSTGLFRLVPMYLWPWTFRTTTFLMPLTTAFLSLVFSSRYCTLPASISTAGEASVCSVLFVMSSLLSRLPRYSCSTPACTWGDPRAGPGHGYSRTGIPFAARYSFTSRIEYVR